MPGLRGPGTTIDLPRNLTTNEVQMPPQMPMSGLERSVRGAIATTPQVLRVEYGDIPFILQPMNSTGVNSSGNPLVLASGGSGSVTFQIPGDCVVEIDEWLATSSAITSSTQPGAPLGFLCAIGFSNNQIKLTQQPVPGELIFSTSAMFRAPWSHRPWVVTIPSNQAFGNMQIDVTNTLTTTNTIYFALKGWNKKRGGV